jgi:hypothetical protein
MIEYNIDSIKRLNYITCAGMGMCKKALEYSNGDHETAIAYIKAKTLAVSTPKLTFDERVQYFKKIGGHYEFTYFKSVSGPQILF